ncbi:MAG: ABC transporter ATP-binding protein [Ignavibacteriae bacterium]|nr:ABC transporter ATP-binding protein [Ignavibacteriota bacterium]
MISIENLEKTYPGGAKAVNGISFRISPGEICGYIGTNGAGKSTTIKIIAGTIPYESGKVKVCGLEVKDNLTEIKKRTGYVPESSDLFSSLSVQEYFDFVCTVRDIGKKTAGHRIAYFSELFGFKSFLNEAIGRLSKGNRQKILITSAMLHNPEILLFDEPLNGLDANSIFVFQDMVSVLAHKGKTIFYCSHLLDMIERISDKIIVLEKGEIIIDSGTKDLKNTDKFGTLEGFFRGLDSGKQQTAFSYEDVFN